MGYLTFNRIGQSFPVGDKLLSEIAKTISATADTDSGDIYCYIPVWFKQNKGGNITVLQWDDIPLDLIEHVYSTIDADNNYLF